MIFSKTLHLLTVGVCLYLVALYMKFMFYTVRRLDCWMDKPFFDIEGLTDEIRAARRNGRNANAQKASLGLMGNPMYRWLCDRLRKAVELR